MDNNTTFPGGEASIVEGPNRTKARERVWFPIAKRLTKRLKRKKHHNHEDSVELLKETTPEAETSKQDDLALMCSAIKRVKLFDHSATTDSLTSEPEDEKKADFSELFNRIIDVGSSEEDDDEPLPPKEPILGRVNNFFILTDNEKEELSRSVPNKNRWAVTGCDSPTNPLERHRLQVKTEILRNMSRFQKHLARNETSECLYHSRMLVKYTERWNSLK